MPVPRSTYLVEFPNDRVTTQRVGENRSPDERKAKISGLYLTNSSNSQYSQSLNGSEGLPATITADPRNLQQVHELALEFRLHTKPDAAFARGSGILQYQLERSFADHEFQRFEHWTQRCSQPRRTVPRISGLCASGTALTPRRARDGRNDERWPGHRRRPVAYEADDAHLPASLTWVKDNHTFKFGGELRIFGYPLHSLTATNGYFVFSANQTAQPYAAIVDRLAARRSDFPYASFLLGLVNNGTVNPPADLKTGKHFIGFYAQDTWKITRKLTLDYGLRYDYDTYPREQYGRMPTLSPTLANPTVGGHPGGIDLRGHLQLQVRQELSVGVRAPGRCRLPDHAQNRVPRRNRHRLRRHRHSRYRDRRAPRPPTMRSALRHLAMPR